MKPWCKAMTWRLNFRIVGRGSPRPKKTHQYKGQGDVWWVFTRTRNVESVLFPCMVCFVVYEKYPKKKRTDCGNIPLCTFIDMDMWLLYQIRNNCVSTTSLFPLIPPADFSCSPSEYQFWKDEDLVPSKTPSRQVRAIPKEAFHSDFQTCVSDMSIAEGVHVLWRL